MSYKYKYIYICAYYQKFTLDFELENNNSTLGLLLDTGVDVPISGVFGDESSNVLLHEGVLVFSVRGESRVLWTGVPVASAAWLSIVLIEDCLFGTGIPFPSKIWELRYKIIAEFRNLV